ncbi:PREDICTED: flavonoid 3'-monooxygenase-like [Erythranthe guttata]|nr:PREDICTED: flavonoid 3'-monooxygenase-like [Erythranthe guttata]|eukprot:XP_012850486.1 PREDICTED: flavonoid 3'-monooxygenase-like [Erythranthe guttata]
MYTDSALAAAVLAVAWVMLLFIVKKSYSRSKNIPALPPGPRGWPLVGNLLSLDPELHTYLATLAQKYGPIYKLKLGRKTGIVISSPSIAKEVLKDQDTTFANRDVPVAGKEAFYGGVNIVWNPYGAEWRMLRKVAVREMLGGATLDSMYTLRRRELRRTVRYLYGKAGSPVDVGEQMFVTVLNVITSMLWGGTVVAAAGDGGGGGRLGMEFKELLGEMTELMGVPNISDFYPGLERFDLQGIGKKMQRLARRFDRIFETIIHQRLKMNAEDKVNESKEDFLQFLLQMKEDGGDAKTPFNKSHLKALLMDMVVGGTETTANMVEYALSEMMNKPEILIKAQNELETIVGKDNIVEESHMKKLPYLHTVMKEVLRLHPALPLLVPHCPSATCNVAGYTIPKGARIFVNVWAIHRDPSVWENPLDFRPERFSDGEWDYSGNDFNYFPFGSGRRMCAAVGMAERMFMYSLASLVHSFDWSLCVGDNLDLSEKYGIVMKKRVPLVAIPTPRLSNPGLYE